MKHQLTQADSALNADQKLSKSHGDLMLHDRVIYCNSKFSKSTDMRRHKHFSRTLHSKGASDHHSFFNHF